MQFILATQNIVPLSRYIPDRAVLSFHSAHFPFKAECEFARAKGIWRFDSIGNAVCFTAIHFFWFKDALRWSDFLRETRNPLFIEAMVKEVDFQGRFRCGYSLFFTYSEDSALLGGEAQMF